MPNYARPLHTNELAYDFLCNVLELETQEADNLCTEVMKAELLLRAMTLKSTLESVDNRRPLYKTDDRRVTLRRRIFDELIEKSRIADEEKISLGEGGAKPATNAKHEKQAIILIGLPASGKSSVAGKLADLTGSYVVDSDYAKRKIPEFTQEFGASIVHEESSLITFGMSAGKYKEEFNLFEYCIAKHCNMVIPKIGSDRESIESLRDALLSKGYSVHLALISLDRQEACRRALYRYIKTKRYVPLSLIFDGYGNEPILTYYRTRDSKEWNSVGKISTLDLREKGPFVVSSKGNGPIQQLIAAGYAK